MIRPITIWSAVAILAVSFQGSGAFGADGHHYRSGGDPSTSHIELRHNKKPHAGHAPLHPGNHSSK